MKFLIAFVLGLLVTLAVYLIPPMKTLIWLNAGAISTMIGNSKWFVLVAVLELTMIAAIFTAIFYVILVTSRHIITVDHQ